MTNAPDGNAATASQSIEHHGAIPPVSDLHQQTLFAHPDR